MLKPGDRLTLCRKVIAKYGDPGDEWKAAVTIASLRAALYGTTQASGYE